MTRFNSFASEPFEVSQRPASIWAYAKVIKTPIEWALGSERHIALPKPVFKVMHYSSKHKVEMLTYFAMSSPAAID